MTTADAKAWNITGNVDDVIRDLTELERRVVPRARTAALNEVMRETKKAAARFVSSRANVKPAAVNKRIYLNKAKVRRPGGYILGLLQGIPIDTLGKARQTAEGVRAGRQFRAGAFVATMPSGKSGAWQRRGRARLPIERAKVEIRHTLTATIDRMIYGGFSKRTFDRVFDRRLRVALEKQARRANARARR